MNNTSHVANFHINMVLSTRNMFKEANVMQSCGALGTRNSDAPVLLFELYLAMGKSGEPSTRFPLGKLVEQRPASPSVHETTLRRLPPRWK